MLYERDYYLGLTETEEQQYEEITGRKFWEKRVSGFGRVNNFMAYPKAARMCKSLFPNNYLDVAELRDVERLEHANEEFLSLLDNTECTERSILNFIREKEYYNIIGSIIGDYLLILGIMEHIYSQNSNWEVRTKLIIFSWERVLEALSLFLLN